MTSSSTPQWPTKSYTSKNTHFPYTAQDLQPMDTSPDSAFYSTPRFVTHIDDHAISVLRQYYGSVLPHSSSQTSDPTGAKPAILDLCSSWISHYPDTIQQAVTAGAVIVAGMGMNTPELDANALFGKDAGRRYLTQDLNETPAIPPFDAIRADAEANAGTASALVSATTLTVSIDYLTSPVAVLGSLLERTEEGGTVHVAVSNRCFPTKAVRRWLRISEEERLEMVAEMLVWGGWGDVEILCLCDGKVQGEEEEEGVDAGASSEGALHRFLSGMGMGGAGAGRRVDPLWVVRGRKKTGGG